jgi:hypothetical protein
MPPDEDLSFYEGAGGAIAGAGTILDGRIVTLRDVT